MSQRRNFTNRIRPPDGLQAGIISRIRLENFMCHSSLEIELGPRVNFITGQNGSGKSAILTALCVAFGSRARGTQRAQTLKDFIKTGCSSALVQVHIENQGEDAFKPEIYGDAIIIERRISDSSNSIILKNSQGKKVASKKDDLREIVEHFNIDVENPCVIMSQDKSREFLHSGSAKDKFKFFFKATLLERLFDLLNGIEKQLHEATAQVKNFEEALRPILGELRELEEKIKSMKRVEEISLEVQLLSKKLAWSYVYDAERRLVEKRKVVEKLKGRIPSCQARIDQQQHKIDELNQQFAEKKCQIDTIVEKTHEARTMKEELEQCYTVALKKELELEEAFGRKGRQIQKVVQQTKLLEQQISDFHEQCNKDTQAEENEMEEKLRELQAMFDEANFMCQRSKEEEADIRRRIGNMQSEVHNISQQIEDAEKSLRETSSNIRDLKMHKTNKVTAFGGSRVTNLLQAIERHQHRFRSPPIGPIGSHLKLENESMWSNAVENAVGGLLEAFIVTDHADSRILKECAREANYDRVKVIIYDFSRPRLVIPRHMLPQTNHPTTFSVLHAENPVVSNVLVDVAGAERQVLVKNYEIGKTIAFDQKIPNLKEVYTSDGYKMFSRGSAQTTLPPLKNSRAGRLCGSFDNQIEDLERYASEARKHAELCIQEKKRKEGELRNLQNMLASVESRRIDEERRVRSTEFKLQDAKNILSSAAASPPSSNVDELHEEISKLHDEMRVAETSQENIRQRVNEARNKAEELQVSLKTFLEKAKSEFNALAEAEEELIRIEKHLNEAEAEKKHYEGVLSTKVLSGLKNAEAELQVLELKYKENQQKASVICPESEVETLEDWKETNPEQLSDKLTTLKRMHQRESQRFSESIDDLKMLYEQKGRKISRKQQIYKSFKEKLEACDTALGLRWSKFRSTARELKTRLTWHFNGNLMKKGISGSSTVSYEKQTLVIEVNMPQDASSTNVSDTRGLSGGERSFSTLCFALALHQMIEAPFRAMDEFDVFMDAVSRKISMDTMVDFALTQGSQWIFITPHDISMVKHDERIKKQQLAAPRG